LVFEPLLDPPPDARGTALVFAVRGSQVAIYEGDGGDGGGGAAGIFLGSLDGRHCWAVDADDRQHGAGVAVFDNLMSLWGSVDEVTWVVAGRAVQLVEWSRTHRFCGRCGERTEETPGERARRCPACGLLAFPRLAPAIIVLVERDDGRALLARNARFPSSMYSCLAGFVEPGETIEQAVVREVREEVGIEVHDLRYMGSQPWPFPHSLMIGFTARWKSGEVQVDGKEIADARWFAPDDLPDIPPSMSIARYIIDGWLERSASVR
jgi:NAD+ diphosphatase